MSWKKNLIFGFFLLLVVSAVLLVNTRIQEKEFTKNSENSPNSELKIGFLTDLHAKSNSINGDRSQRRIKDVFTEIVDNFRNELAKDLSPDLIVLNGDVIEGTNRDDVVGTGELREIKKQFDTFPAQKIWAIGNHDLRAVDKDEWKESLGINYLFRSFSVKGYKIIVLDSNFYFDPETIDEDTNVQPGLYFTRGKLSSLQLKWLEVELRKDEQKSLIFIHHPPLLKTQAQSGSQFLYDADAEAFQKIVSENGNVLAVFSGHIEELHHKRINNIDYFVIPGSTKSPEFPKNFAEIDVKNDGVSVLMKYQKTDGSYEELDINLLNN